MNGAVCKTPPDIIFMEDAAEKGDSQGKKDAQRIKTLAEKHNVPVHNFAWLSEVQPIL